MVRFRYHPHSVYSIARVVLFSECLFVTIYLSVCLSVNMITPEPLEISSCNFRGIILGQVVKVPSNKIVLPFKINMH